MILEKCCPIPSVSYVNLLWISAPAVLGPRSAAGSDSKGGALGHAPRRRGFLHVVPLALHDRRAHQLRPGAVLTFAIYPTTEVVDHLAFIGDIEGDFLPAAGNVPAPLPNSLYPANQHTALLLSGKTSRDLSPTSRVFSKRSTQNFKSPTQKRSTRVVFFFSDVQN